MNLKAMIHSVALVSAAFAAVPMAGAAPCGDSAIHTFTGPGNGGVTVEDTCTAVTPVVDPNDPTATDVMVGDNDRDSGTGGGAFPALQTDCVAVSPHHPGGISARYYATNILLPMAWTAGTDGQIPGVPVTPGFNDCTGNGIISNDYNTDPYDCYSGVGGSTSGGSPYAEVQPNVFIPSNPPTPDPWNGGAGNPYAACNAMDGDVWVFLLAGVFIRGLDDFSIHTDTTTTPPTVTANVPANPGLTLSVPLQGTIYG